MKQEQMMMANIEMSRGKFERIQACADERGIIAALAIDQRDTLRKSIERVRAEPISGEEMTLFKQLVTQALSPYASAVLLDPEYGLPALEARAPGKGALLAYEKTGYDASVKGRLPDLLPQWSARRLVEAGASAIKILLYFNPFDDERINIIKRAFVERVGSECAALDVPFFLEPLAYDDRYDTQGLEFARLKPRYVRTIMEEFSLPRYGVDILKVEVPINAAYLAGSQAYKGGDVAYDRRAALDHFRGTAAAAGKPFLYLSAGVDEAVFRESLELAAEVGVPFSGVLCGRANWKGGVPAFAHGGSRELETWLAEQGVQNIRALNETLTRYAQPWYSFYGGLENIVVNALNVAQE
jgi:tagatose 1,6-diphosphate aldolase